MKTILTTTAVFLTIVALGNFCIDAEGKFLGSSFYKLLKYPKSENEVLSVPPNHNQRLIKTGFINTSESMKFDSIVLGSSRGLLVGSDELNDKKVLNLAVSTASIEEYDLFYKKLIDKKITTGKFIIILDYWQFNENVLGDDISSLKSGSKRFEYKKIKDLISFDFFITNFKYFYSNFQNFNLHFKKIDSKYRDETLYSYKNSGELMYPVGVMKVYDDLEKFQAYVKSLHENVPSHYIYNDYKFSPRKIVLLNDLMKKMKKAGAKVYVVVLPFSKKQLELVAEHPKFSIILSDFKNSVLNLNGSKICNSLDESQYDCGELEMYDSVHPTKACLIKVLSKCIIKTKEETL